ncbi:alpha/beta fold hydrolase [Pseudomonas sp.]|uniref:alpha/beta fold hydrolase n=1 Tax=Pseudomonas sp. TaxID=306 RepID=UPI0027364B09|nr:alpha/beta hydrolase [Pseudomonas sp.]MDP3815717.1 alpha/beta hydrolase [Pseudomonas sp.]
MSNRTALKNTAKGLGIGALSLSLGWLALAWNSGQLRPNDARWALTAGEFTDDGFSAQKKLMTLPDGSQVAYLDIGQGPALVLLHGCPFSVFEWNAILPELSKHYRVIAPDLRGLGDTPVRLNDDYRLDTDVKMLSQLLDALAVESADFVAHDHGGAVAQLLMRDDPTRIQKLVLSNVEAYDQWPSAPEIPILKAIVSPLSSPLMYHALKFEWVQRQAFAVAVFDQQSLTAEVLRGYALPHVASKERWQRLRRFFTWQLDPNHAQSTTVQAVPAMRAFKAPTLLLWGEQDNNFGPQLARRLARDIPGVQGIEYLHKSAHMPFQEQPAQYAQALLAFLQTGAVTEQARQALASARASSH